MGLLREDSLPARDYDHGEEVVIGDVLPLARTVTLTLDRCTTINPSTWPDPHTFVEVEIVASFDGGQTWMSGGGFGAYGGIFVTKNGEASFSGNLACRWPGGGRAKIKYTVYRGPDTPGPLEVAAIARHGLARGSRTMTEEWTPSAARVSGWFRSFDDVI